MGSIWKKGTLPPEDEKHRDLIDKIGYALYLKFKEEGRLKEDLQ